MKGPSGSAGADFGVDGRGSEMKGRYGSSNEWARRLLQLIDLQIAIADGRWPCSLSGTMGITPRLSRRQIQFDLDEYVSGPFSHPNAFWLGHVRILAFKKPFTSLASQSALSSPPPKPISPAHKPPSTSHRAVRSPSTPQTDTNPAQLAPPNPR